MRSTGRRAFRTRRSRRCAGPGSSAQPFPELSAAVARLLRTSSPRAMSSGRAVPAPRWCLRCYQIPIASLVRHTTGSAWHRDFLARIAAEQLLIASVTTEAGSGGDVRRSECAVQTTSGQMSVAKAGCVISYAEQADAFLITARRAPESDAGDQVAVLARREQCVLDPIAQWDTLGMRGTCSRSYSLSVAADPAQIVPDSYATISAQTMLPVSHITWSAAWLGIASAACQRARRTVRRRAVPGGAAPAGSLRLTQALAQLQALRSQVADATRRFEAAGGDVDALHSIAFALGMNQLKLTVSTGVVQVIGEAMLASGLAGYRNDGAGSLGRHLRDAALCGADDRQRSHPGQLCRARQRLPGRRGVVPLNHIATPSPTFANRLFDAGLLIPTEVAGLTARSGAFEAVVDGLDRLISTLGREPAAEVIRFPPAMTRGAFEKSGYMRGFPQLAGSIHCFCGNEREHRALLACIAEGQDWSGGLAPAEAVLTVTSVMCGRTLRCKGIRHR